ncbi:glyoxalase superfamily protein [Microbacterium sp.]|uniref:glyoxalase superfamily protein n=1 Tax=Microbacterium sp. TaxID=51671 RepID=UPI003C74EA95
MVEYRVHFDATVRFANGGSLDAHGFRLDLPSSELTPEQIGELFIRHLGLTMVGSVELSELTVVEEAHKGSRGVPRADRETRPRLVELNHTIRGGMTTYPGLPGPQITTLVSREQSADRYANGTTFAIHNVSIVGNTGTYLDSPFHRYENGADLDALLLERVADLPAEVFHLTDLHTRGIPAEVFWDREVSGRAVLLHTGWDRHFTSPAYAEEAPFLTAAGAEYLAEKGARLVGIDSVNIDDIESPARDRPAHSTLLAAGIPIVEHLTNLDELPATGIRFTATPPRLAGVGTFPVRAFALIGAPPPPDASSRAAIPVLGIQDESLARAFYLDYLGFAVEWEHRFEPGLPLYMRVRRAETLLDLSEHHGDGVPGTTAWIPVASAAAFHADISEKPYPRLRPGIDRDVPGGPTIEVIDPFGNHLRFCESTS